MADRLLELLQAGRGKSETMEPALSPSLRMTQGQDLDRGAAQITNKIEAHQTGKPEPQTARDTGEGTLQPTKLEHQPPHNPQRAPSMVPGGMSSHYTNTPRQRAATAPEHQNEQAQGGAAIMEKPQAREIPSGTMTDRLAVALGLSAERRAAPERAEQEAKPDRLAELLQQRSNRTPNDREVRSTDRTPGNDGNGSRNASLFPDHERGGR